MTAKTFRILSNSDEFLSAEVVAGVLLKQISLRKNGKKVYFAVMDCADKDAR